MTKTTTGTTTTTPRTPTWMTRRPVTDVASPRVVAAAVRRAAGGRAMRRRTAGLPLTSRSMRSGGNGGMTAEGRVQMGRHHLHRRTGGRVGGSLGVQAELLFEAPVLVHDVTITTYGRTALYTSTMSTTVYYIELRGSKWVCFN